MRRTSPAVASPSVPSPVSYGQRTPKKMIRLALRSALSDRAAEGKVLVVDGWGFDAPSTKAAKAALGALGLDGRVLVVVDRDDATSALSFRNLPEVQLIQPGELNAYDVLCNDWIVFTSANVVVNHEEQVVADAPDGGARPGPGRGPRVTRPTDEAEHRRRRGRRRDPRSDRFGPRRQRR